MQNRRNKGKTSSGLTVMVRGDDINGALRVLKKRLMKDGFFQELRERSHFVSKGEQKRKAKERTQIRKRYRN